ncbi:hypothetical protein, partial [Arthrobacter antibioticus]|uniref:hypothetical protein n=1 Tax=Arthrobacter sp. H35-MC1 TaxID=3046203 RepID=UPI0024BBDA72
YPAAPTTRKLAAGPSRLWAHPAAPTTRKLAAGPSRLWAHPAAPSTRKLAGERALRNTRREVSER